MKKLLIALSIVLLSACANPVGRLPSTPLLPEPPVSLQNSLCPDALPGVLSTEGVKMADILYATALNSKTYYQCAGQAKEWASWYKDQQTKELEQIKNEYNGK